jgi:hypothetical protein
MRSTILLLILFLATIILNAQGFQQDIITEDIDELCFGYQSEAADQEAERVVDQMMAQMQLKRVFQLRKCSKIQNAVATIQKDDNDNLSPYILYDPSWLKRMADESKTDWASIGVLAHEVGHFLLYHALNNKGSNPRWEIDADRFAGKTLAMMGSTLAEAQSMFDNYTLEEDSRTHPGRSKRLEAVKTGWMSVNNPTKQVILNENTAERDITSELIINKYYESAGGLKNLGKISELNFTEEITESIGEGLNDNKSVTLMEYQQSPNTTLISKKYKDLDYNEEYLVKNDSLFNKFSDEENWNQGAPRIGTSIKTEPYEFKRDKRPVSHSFFEDFVLVSNPELASYGGRKRFGNEECFELQLPVKTIEIGNLKKKGKRVTIEKQYYFHTSTGMLHGIVEKENIAYFKKGNPKKQETKKIEWIINSYEDVDGILFPSEVDVSSVPLRYDVPEREKGIFQKRKITNINFKATSEL